MNAVALPLLLFVAWQIVRLKPITRATTAAGALYWAFTAVAACLVTAVCHLETVAVTPRTGSVLQYLSAVLLLTPLVHILGARRPGITAWPWFVVLPLIAVLQWPAASELLGNTSDAAIRIPSPTVVGYLLVLLMGSGNYFGTACTSSMLLGVSGVTLILLPVTEWVAFSEKRLFLPGCTMLATAAALLPRQFFRQHVAEREHGQLWSDFRDLYGLVWAMRVMDRVNQFATRERWDVRLTLDGFEAAPVESESVAGTDIGRRASATGSPVEPSVRAWQVLCWVLRRFVETDFVRRYMPESPDLQDGPVN